MFCLRLLNLVNLVRAFSNSAFVVVGLPASTTYNLLLNCIEDGWSRFLEPFMSCPNLCHEIMQIPSLSLSDLQLPWSTQVLGQIDYVTTFLSPGDLQLLKPVFFTEAWIVYLYIQCTETPVNGNSETVNHPEDDLQYVANVVQNWRCKVVWWFDAMFFFRQSLRMHVRVSTR